MIIKSEKQLFEFIWNNREHKCEICWKYVIQPIFWCFAHKLAKWIYPQFKLIKENIALVCWLDCHKKIDSLYSKTKRVEFYEYLTQKYLKWEIGIKEC